MATMYGNPELCDLLAMTNVKESDLFKGNNVFSVFKQKKEKRSCTFNPDQLFDVSTYKGRYMN